NHHQPAGVGDGDAQPPIFLFQRHEVVAEHQIDGDGPKQIVLDVVVLQIDKLAAIATRQILGARLFIAWRHRALTAAIYEYSFLFRHDQCCILAPKLKMGRYSDSSTPATTRPIKIKITGSISAMAAARAVCTSSSKNSATEFSMGRSAPVLSPTSIISTAKSGKAAVFSRLLASGCPSLTRIAACATALAIQR